MYCIRCGVELSPSEERCPLCQTRVVHPDLDIPVGEKPYPNKTVAHRTLMSASGILFLITVGFVIAALVMIECDWELTGHIDWSGIAVGGLALIYVSAILPCWFRKPNPVIFVPCAFAAAIVYLFYINYVIGGNWFWSFALPVTGALTLIVTTPVTLFRYLHKGYLYITGGLLIALGGFAVLVEYLLYVTFQTGGILVWSIYPLTALFLSGMALMVIAICKPLRSTLHKKFFV